MSDFADIEINPEIIRRGKEAQQALAELEERALREGMNELERMLVRCIWKGHDFMDVHVDELGNVEYVGWDEGHEPEWHHDIFDAPADTYDLRRVTYQDIREAHKDHR